MCIREQIVWQNKSCDFKRNIIVALSNIKGHVFLSSCQLRPPVNDIMLLSVPKSVLSLRQWQHIFSSPRSVVDSQPLVKLFTHQGQLDTIRGPKKQNIEKIPKCTVCQHCTTQRVKLINSYIFSAWFKITWKKSWDQFVASVFSEIMISTRLLSKSLPPLDFANGRQLVAGTVQICSLLLKF